MELRCAGVALLDAAPMAGYHVKWRCAEGTALPGPPPWLTRTRDVFLDLRVLMIRCTRGSYGGRR